MTHARAIQGTSRSLNVRFKNPEEATSPMAGICKSVIAAIFVWLVPQDMNFCSSYMPPSYETLDLHASLLLRALHRNGSFSLSLEITNILFVFTNFFFYLYIYIYNNKTEKFSFSIFFICYKILKNFPIIINLNFFHLTHLN